MIGLGGKHLLLYHLQAIASTNTDLIPSSMVLIDIYRYFSNKVLIVFVDITGNRHEQVTFKEIMTEEMGKKAWSWFLSLI